MTQHIGRHGLKVAPPLIDLVENSIIPGTGVDADGFWKSYSEILTELGPVNRNLLAKRATLQVKINDWHSERNGQNIDPAEYRAFLEKIGYIVPEGGDFT